MKSTTAVFLLILCCVGARAQSDLEKKLFDLVNQERARARAGKLEWNEKLAQAALEHSKLLEQHQALSHRFAGEPTLPERVGATGARVNAVAENVAEAPDVFTIHAGLMGSPGHRENILNEKYNAVGISIVEHGSQLFVTQDFGHIVSYNEKDFQDTVVSVFAQMRKANRLRRVDVVADAQLRKVACAKDMNTKRVIQTLPGSVLAVVFSASDAASVREPLREAASDQSIERMNIGVCMESAANGFTRFWVVAAFYPRSGNHS